MIQYIIIGLFATFVSYLHLTKNPMHEILFLIEEEKKRTNDEL
tara:strand:+ start:3761 stop:3889 length:129 start_codon:yes stop_codon:yes gene_type:complete